MGRPRKYTRIGLEKAVQRYFDSISREVTVTEKVDSGERDDKGHVIWEQVPIINKLGEEIRVTEFAVPPTVRVLAENAFSRCVSLERLSLPAGLTAAFDYDWAVPDDFTWYNGDNGQTLPARPTAVPEE